MIQMFYRRDPGCPLRDKLCTDFSISAPNKDLSKKFLDTVTRQIFDNILYFVFRLLQKYIAVVVPMYLLCFLYWWVFLPPILKRGVTFSVLVNCRTTLNSLMSPELSDRRRILNAFCPSKKLKITYFLSYFPKWNDISRSRIANRR